MQIDSDWLATGEDRELVSSLDPERIPRHVAIIMDGNGRWANRRGLPRIAGHRAGVSAVRETVEACARFGVEALTLYAFSSENWKRPRPEVDMLWRLLRHYLQRELAELNRNGVSLRAIGRLEALPETVQEEIQFVEERTRSNRGLRLNLAINYSGRGEIVDAVNSAIRAARLSGTLDTLQLDEERISSGLYANDIPDPDLLIRTSGEMRISNFLLWQIAYAELYVTNTLWPDFGRSELLRAFLQFQKRDRRFGGLSNITFPDANPANSIDLFEETAVSSK